PRPRLPRRRGSRRQRDCGKHPDPAGVVLLRRHLTPLVALRGKDIDAFLARPDAARPLILLYGTDAGLVRERAEALIASAVDNPDDPFSVVRLDGDELAAEPSRLVDEAMTVPLFGGRRAIRVRAGSRNFAGGVDTLAE